MVHACRHLPYIDAWAQEIYASLKFTVNTASKAAWGCTMFIKILVS